MLTSADVVDQEGPRFYTDVLGFVKNADFSQGPFRWLTVASAEDPDGTDLQLRLTISRRLKATRRRCSHKARQRPCPSPATCRPITSV